MKKQILLALALIVSGAQASQSVVLEKTLRPAKGLVGGAYHNVKVFEDGLVKAESRVGAPPFKIKYTHFTPAQMRRIERLVRRAYDGEDVLPGPIHCLAIPTQLFAYTADDGKLNLKRGARPCGGTTYNDSVEAKRLVDILDAVALPGSEVLEGEIN